MPHAAIPTPEDAVSAAARRRRRAALLRGATAASILLSGFLCGFNVSLFRQARAGDAPPAANLTPVELLTRVIRPDTARAAGRAADPLAPPDAYLRTLGAIKRSYVGPAAATPANLSTKKLTYAAIDGMLASIGDPYTTFWTPEEYDENMQETSGNFVGIGTRLDTAPDGRTVIVEVYENSPAARAGIQPGDIIAAVDGRPTAGKAVQTVIDQIHGEEDTYVRLTVRRANKPILFNLRRAVVHSPIVEWRMQDPARGIGYIGLGMFNEQADNQFDAALARLEKQGMKALIFDLRDNPGGLLQVAQDLGSRFIEDGPVVWVKEKNGRLSSMDVEKSKHRSPLYRGAYPVAVLVNGGSASAAEIVAGAIQDAGAGALVGTRTYGKGLVQTIMPLPDESAVKITTQHYFTRDKHDINTKRDSAGRPIAGTGGVVPDLAVEFTDRDDAARREQLRRDPKNVAAADRLDPQMRRAQEFLAAELARGPRD